MDISKIFNIVVLLLSIVVFIIGFINEQYRLISWSVSLLVIAAVILFIIFSEYFSKIDKNSIEIDKLKKDLNIERRLTILETKFEEYNKKR